MNDIKLKIGTRGSKLALAQAYAVRDLLQEAHAELAKDGAIEIVIIVTSGDRIQDRSLLEAGGKGLFTKEIEEALIAGEIDIAVHSMKDVPACLPDGLEIECILPREEPWDAFLSPIANTLWELPEGATLGTSGVRRKALALAARPDLKIELFRGNVDTRLKKLHDGVVDATFLAVAGLNRLGLENEITTKLTAEEMLPAAGQGAVGIETCIKNESAKTLLAKIHCKKTAICVLAERAFIKVLDGSCRTPIAAYACFENEDSNTMHIQGLVAKLDGSEIWYEEEYVSADLNDTRFAIDAGEALGTKVKEQIPDDVFKELSVL